MHFSSRRNDNTEELFLLFASQLMFLWTIVYISNLERKREMMIHTAITQMIPHTVADFSVCITTLVPLNHFMTSFRDNQRWLNLCVCSDVAKYRGQTSHHQCYMDEEKLWKKVGMWLLGWRNERKEVYEFGDFVLCFHSFIGVRCRGETS